MSGWLLKRANSVSEAPLVTAREEKAATSLKEKAANGRTYWFSLWTLPVAVKSKVDSGALFHPRSFSGNHKPGQSRLITLKPGQKWAPLPPPLSSTMKELCHFPFNSQNSRTFLDVCLDQPSSAGHPPSALAMEDQAFEPTGCGRASRHAAYFIFTSARPDCYCSFAKTEVKK